MSGDEIEANKWCDYDMRVLVDADEETAVWDLIELNKTIDLIADNTALRKKRVAYAVLSDYGFTNEEIAEAYGEESYRSVGYEMNKLKSSDRLYDLRNAIRELQDLEISLSQVDKL